MSSFPIIRSAAVALAAFACAGPLGYGAGTAGAAQAPRAVSLSQAVASPDWSAVVAPGATAWVPDVCLSGYASDASVYRVSGRAVGAQRQDRDRTGAPRLYWPTGTGRVTYNGVAFRSHSARPVLAAVSC